MLIGQRNLQTNTQQQGKIKLFTSEIKCSLRQNIFYNYYSKNIYATIVGKSNDFLLIIVQLSVLWLVIIPFYVMWLAIIPFLVLWLVIIPFSCEFTTTMAILTAPLMSKTSMFVPSSVAEGAGCLHERVVRVQVMLFKQASKIFYNL